MARRRRIGPQKPVMIGKRRVQRRVPRLVYRGESNGKAMYSLESKRRKRGKKKNC